MSRLQSNHGRHRIAVAIRWSRFDEGRDQIAITAVVRLRSRTTANIGGRRVGFSATSRPFRWYCRQDQQCRADVGRGEGRPWRRWPHPATPRRRPRRASHRPRPLRPRRPRRRVWRRGCGHVDDVEEDEIGVLRDAGGGTAARNVSTPGRSDRAHVVEDVGDVDDDEEDEIVVLRGTRPAAEVRAGGPLLRLRVALRARPSRAGGPLLRLRGWRLRPRSPPRWPRPAEGLRRRRTWPPSSRPPTGLDPRRRHRPRSPRLAAWSGLRLSRERRAGGLPLPLRRLRRRPSRRGLGEAAMSAVSVIGFVGIGIVVIGVASGRRALF